jgi:hypothetical protein
VWAIPGLTTTTMQLVYDISPATTNLLINYGSIFFLGARHYGSSPCGSGD